MRIEIDIGTILMVSENDSSGGGDLLSIPATTRLVPMKESITFPNLGPVSDKLFDAKRQSIVAMPSIAAPIYGWTCKAMRVVC